MTPEQRFEAANEINDMWISHIRYGHEPPDVLTVARIIELHEIGKESADNPIASNNLRRMIGK